MKKLLLSLTLSFIALVVTTSAQNELFNKGLQQFDARQYEQAAITFGQVVAQQPNFYQAHFNLGLCQYNLKRYDEAISSFQKSVSIKPDYARANYWLGNALYNQKRYDEAIPWYQKTIQYEPKNENAHYKLGLVLQDQKKYLEAEKYLKLAVELKPGNSDFNVELGNVYVNLKRFPESIVVFNEAVRLSPDSAGAQLGLGNAYYNNNKWAESIPYYKKAGELSPTWATAHLYVADAYYKTKQFGPAISSYETAISLDNKRAESFYGIGLTYVALKNKPLAQQTLTTLRNLDPVKANLLQNEINKMSAGPVTPPPVKTAQRLKDEQDVAKMADFGFDGAVVTQVSTVRENPQATGRLLLSVKRGDILSLVVQEDTNGWFQVVDEKTGVEGWIDGKAVVVKLTSNKVTGPPLLESGTSATLTANPVLLVSNLEEKTTLSLRINGTLYKIAPKSTKTISVPPGKMNYYGWSPGIRPALGSSNLERGRQYTWSFKINRR